jgi:acetylornithine deacetylase/succinyl-diaminopimelate desuccinylase-like protein
MPFRPWLQWRPERDRPTSLARELARLCADPRVHRLFEWFLRHEREIAELQLDITAIPAPAYAEHTRAEWLRQRLAPLGLTLSTDAVGNLLAIRPGLGSGEAQPAIALSAHLDTVFPASADLNVRRENGLLLGAGISDNGSGLAALWAIAAAFHQLEIPTALPLLFLANVGEEGEGNLRGIRHVYREHLPSPAPDSAPAQAIAMLIALDGAGVSSVISQALGSRRFEVVITGPGGHSWSDYGVPNPLVAAALAVRTLSRIPLPAQPRTTLNIASIHGGTSINAIPSRAVVRIDVRSADSRRLDELELQLRTAFADACTATDAQSPHSAPRLSHTIANVGERPAGELAYASPLFSGIRAVDAHLGIHAQLQRASTDANIPLSLGLEAISLGSGGSGGGAHTLQEWYDPAGRELGLKRIALLLLLLAGLPPLPDASAPESRR